MAKKGRFVKVVAACAVAWRTQKPALQGRLAAPPNPRNPFLVLGKTALFFYLVHFPLLAVAAGVLGLAGKGGLPQTYVAAAAAVVVLYPACRWYGRYKAAHPNGLTQYI